MPLCDRHAGTSIVRLSICSSSARRRRTRSSTAPGLQTEQAPSWSCAASNLAEATQAGSSTARQMRRDVTAAGSVFAPERKCQSLYLIACSSEDSRYGPERVGGARTGMDLAVTPALSGGRRCGSAQHIFDGRFVYVLIRTKNQPVLGRLPGSRPKISQQWRRGITHWRFGPGGGIRAASADTRGRAAASPLIMTRWQREETWFRESVSSALPAKTII